jgi:multiple sugar transport system permease protein
MVWTLAPFIWLIISSISPEYELLSTPPHLIPQNPTIKNYMSLFAESDFIKSMFNSLIVSLSSTILCVSVALFTAYAFSRFNFFGKNTIFTLILIVGMMPAVVVAIPLFLIFYHLNLIDTHIGLILSSLIFVLPFVTLVLRGYLESVPLRELEDAAKVDGCSRIQVIIKIVFPLSKPGLIAAAIFAFLSSWDQFFFALLLALEKSKTLPVFLAQFLEKYRMDWGVLCAGSIISTLPPTLLAFIFQKYIIRGLRGAVKG